MNYQNELELIIATMQKPKKLLLHSCCAPCSSYVLEYLSAYFEITVFYFNPNITNGDEYKKRSEEQESLIHKMNASGHAKYPITFLEREYSPKEFFNRVQGLEKEPEGGKRCVQCFSLRLEETARAAKEEKYDYFTTTLTISPLKNAEIINQIGKDFEKIYSVSFLPSDFKKKNGYKRSVELSKEFGLYRQEYCGCIYSKQQRETEKMEKPSGGNKK